MNNKNELLKGPLVCVVGLALMTSTSIALAQYGGGGGGGGGAPSSGGDSNARNAADDGARPLIDGSYIAPMVHYRMSEDDPELDSGLGGQIMAGYRNNGYGLEAGLGYMEEQGVQLATFNFNILLYPFDSVPFLYGLAGIGSTYYKGYPVTRDQNAIAGGDDFNTVNAQGGLGYMLPLQWGRYEYALRAEALYRWSDRFLERETDFIEDIPAPRSFTDILINVGLQLPFKKLPPPPPPPEPVAVVEPDPICSDSIDNDGDGFIDFPDDKGCTSADDNDETDPPICSDGLDNDGDGFIDFPDDKGCEAADDQDEVDPCKKPAPGERISLQGCGTGDVVVLRGVNFEFDRAVLTANAKAILDNVAQELNAYPNIEVELSGHTDSRGSDKYNKRLSDKRAASVKEYLMGQGVSADRMTTVGFGETQPVATNDTDAGRDANRRTELKVTAGIAGSDGTDVRALSANPNFSPGSESTGDAEADAYIEESEAAPAADDDSGF